LTDDKFTIGIGRFLKCLLAALENRDMSMYSRI